MRRKIIILILLLIIAGGGFFIFKRIYSSKKPHEVTVRSDAETIAKKFLDKQEFKNDYESDPISVETYPDFWNVWFATVDKNKRPNRGLVQINRSTGEAEWKELQ